MDNYLNVANSWVLWLAAFPLLIAVLFQAVIFSKKEGRTHPTFLSTLRRDAPQFTFIV